MVFTLYDSEEGLKGALESDTDLFDSRTIARMLKHYEQLLASVASDPDQPYLKGTDAYRR